MSVDMTKWCEIAKANMGKRPAGEGRLGGKICIVTGAAQGFGKGIAEELYKEGATIVIADMNEPLAKQVAEEMGERAVAIAVNVSDEESVANMVAQTVEKFGGLDLMLSNAGVVRSGPLAHVEKKDFDFVTSVNYTGFFLCAKYAAIIMEAEHEADPEAMFDIVTLNSKSGLEGSNKNFAYAGSKFGGIGLTQSFALELCAQHQGQRCLPGQLPRWPAVVRPGARSVRAVSRGGQGSRRKDRRGRAPLLRGQGSDEPRLPACRCGARRHVLRRAEVRDWSGHPRHRRSGHAELRAAR